MTTGTAQGNRVLFLGIDPDVLDQAATGFDPAVIKAGIEKTMEDLKNLRYDATFLNLGWDDAEATVQKHLQTPGNTYDACVIGAGVRTVPKTFLMFENLINILREQAPHTKICFNQSPQTSVDAIERWLPSASLPADAKGAARSVYA